MSDHWVGGARVFFMSKIMERDSYQYLPELSPLIILRSIRITITS